MYIKANIADIKDKEFLYNLRFDFAGKAAKDGPNLIMVPKESGTVAEAFAMAKQGSTIEIEMRPDSPTIVRSIKINGKTAYAGSNAVINKVWR